MTKQHDKLKDFKRNQNFEQVLEKEKYEKKNSNFWIVREYSITRMAKDNKQLQKAEWSVL